MKAVAIENYGDSDVMKLMELPEPALREDDVLVEVHAAGINPVDWKIRKGYMREMIRYEFPLVLGWDLAGVVKKTGPKVRDFKAGDEVYGRPDITRNGSFAEYVAVSESLIARKPDNLAFEEAASIPLAGETAWQALVDTAKVHAGQKVLIHGGAGGVGSLAIQIGKAVLSAHVAATTSGRNRDFVLRLGADIAIDYEHQDFSKLLEDYDAVLDTVGGETLAKSYQVVRKGGILISTVAIPDPEEAKRWGIKSEFVLLKPDRRKLEELGKRLEEGIIRPVVTRVFTLEEAQEALELSETQHVRGKLVIKVR